MHDDLHTVTPPIRDPDYWRDRHERRKARLRSKGGAMANLKVRTEGRCRLCGKNAWIGASELPETHTPPRTESRPRHLRACHPVFGCVYGCNVEKPQG